MDPGKHHSSQLRAGGAINSFLIAARVVGPPGSGKTYVLVSAMLGRLKNKNDEEVASQVPAVSTIVTSKISSPLDPNPDSRTDPIVEAPTTLSTSATGDPLIAAQGKTSTIHETWRKVIVKEPELPGGVAPRSSGGEVKTKYVQDDSMAKSLELPVVDDTSSIKSTDRSTSVLVKVARPITAICTSTNLASNNVAQELFERGHRRFRFVVAENFFNNQSKIDGGAMQKLQDEGLLWRPGLIEARKGTKTKTTQTHKKKLKNIDIVLLTVSIFLSTKLISQVGMLHTPIVHYYLHVAGNVKIVEMIFEDGSQVPVCSVLPILYEFDQIKRIVLVGDSAQLPPFGACGGRVVTSLFDAFDEAGGTSVFMEMQRRIPSPIATILSEVSYEGKLLTSPEKLVPPCDCLCWINVNGTETTHELSKYNIQETEAIYGCLHAIKQRRLDQPTVVLTFYTSQVLKLRALLKDFDVEIVTVDSYQGREKDMVFLSLVNTKSVGFLSDIRRVNVALSRVRKQLWVVGALDFWKDQAAAAPAISRVAQLCIKEELTWTPPPL